MNRLCGAIFLLVGLMTNVSHATDPQWVNNGTIVVAPVIDATNFINNGTISIVTTVPFDTSNTQNFTNTGSMNGSVGFKFDNAPRNSSGQLIGLRKLAANFHNRVTGSINGSPFLLVNATNLINQGALSTDASGLIQIVGTNLNISRSALSVASILASASLNGATNFTPSSGISDNYWGQTNDNFNISRIATNTSFQEITISNSVLVTNTVFATIAQSPLHDVTQDNVNYFPTFLSVLIPTNFPNLIAANTNQGSPTNLFRQAVFVRLPSTNMTANIRFSPSPNPTNFFRGVGIEIIATQTNVVTQSTETNFIYLSDTLASTTNRGTLLNNVTRTGRRPANYILSRLPVPTFTGGLAGNAQLGPNFLFAPDFDSQSSSGDYAAYSASIDNLTSRPTPIPAGDYTNNPGRIEIYANSLDMNKARIKAEGLLTINAKHLINSANAVVDSENLSIMLGSTNGNLVVQNLMKESVQRLRGDISVWSAVWTNGFTPPSSTNAVGLNFHVLIVDASQISDVFPVNVFELQTTSTNIVINDNALIQRGFVAKGDSLTINGSITFQGTLQNWSQSSAPTLKNFTNNGTLIVPSEAHFGDDTMSPYLNFVNNGTISSVGQNVRAQTALINGQHLTAANFNLQATTGKIAGGEITSGGSISLAASSLVLTQAFIVSSGSLFLDVTNSLSDAGSSSDNILQSLDGVYMTRKAPLGDLLGTEIDSFASDFAQVNHVWGGRNDGANNSGYTNNGAIGTLRLEGGFDPLFVFSGLGTNNGLYVDLLDISSLTDYSSQLIIDPNLVIYYAAATASVTPTNGSTVEAFLDGQFGGRLRWVSSFAGPNSSTNVTINGGQVISVNSALRSSSSLDSDADGIVNSLDANPFGGVAITSIQRNMTPAGYKLTWNAAPSTTYRVECRTNLLVGSWGLQFTTTPTNAVVSPWTVLDTNIAPAGVSRYYRVTYSPNEN